MTPQVEGFRDPATDSVTYVVSNPASGRAALIDPVLEYRPASGAISFAPADRAIAAVEKAGLTLDWIIETHVHADHLSAAQYVKSRLGGRVAISGGVLEVQRHFARVFNLGADFSADGSDFDRLFSDGERFALGEIKASVLHTPGHTAACACYVIGDAAFVGDTLLMPDTGCGRCDFPGGSAAVLHDSLQRVLALDPATRMFVGHDSGAGGKREPAWETTVAEQHSNNIYSRGGISQSEFIARREARDAQLSTPRLMLPAMQVNIRAGRLPAPESNGRQYLKIPLNGLKSWQHE